MPWSIGRTTLTRFLEREHDVVPWVDEVRRPRRGSNQEDDIPTRVTVGSSVYFVPSRSAVRYREGVALLNLAGRIRVLTERGEVLLTPDEEAALTAHWPLL